ncbi:MAG: zinc-dependent metalloprotease, partial [Bacteroidetes bacterium]|nr:zinc-dependent metalloprotease [Bacteroidota bacterium]
MHSLRTLAPLGLSLLLALSACSALRPSATPPDNSNGGESGDDDDDIKQYSEVVTDEAETDEGLFDIHWFDEGEKVLFEIPDSLLGREMLLVSRIARTAENLGYGGQKTNTQVVRWERHAKNILLRTVSYNIVASDSLPVYQAVRNSSFEPIIASFAIKAYAVDTTGAVNDTMGAVNDTTGTGIDTTGVVIDVTDLYAEDTPLLGMPRSVRERYKVQRMDTDRSFIARASSYPENIEIRVVQTYEAEEPPSNSSTGTISLEMNHSMILLPEEPMQPRLFDQRVGFFALTQTDYGSDAQEADQRTYVTRWRLEPSDPEAYARGEVVDPVEPIVYYIDPATPERWISYLKQGVEDWLPAFEAAGFSNAIEARDAPTPEEDPEFSPEDIRYSVIRYFASPVQNASGPHVHDPRSGEILESDINWYHNIMNLLRNWYFIQTAAANPDARGVEFDEDVMGELIRFVSAHEVGHTLGLRHNFYSSSSVPVDSLRSRTYTDTHGTAPSIMDYARFNYVAQPGDGVRRFTPDIGEYDIHAIEWGYRVFPGADTDAEKPMTSQIARRAVTDPRLRFVMEAVVATDPRAQNEDLGDDAVLAGQYGLANLRRIVIRLQEWGTENLEPYDDLQELYNNVVSQWVRYVNHAGSNVGGVYIDYKTADEPGPVYTVVDRERQQRSLDFVLEEGMQKPGWLLNQDVLRRIEAVGTLDRIRSRQVSMLNRLLDPNRIARLLEAEAVDSEDAFSASEMLSDVRNGLWSELAGGAEIGPFRRNLQRGY